jgi:hypothetical protein
LIIAVNVVAANICLSGGALLMTVRSGAIDTATNSRPTSAALALATKKS